MLLFILSFTLNAFALNLSPQISSDAALSELRAGNTRFAEGKSTHPAQAIDYRKSLVAGQKPPVIVLSCSDSRVPPEIIFDQGLGQVFTVRVAGNILEPSTDASIEYAVEHLGSSLIVVLGHDSCGAVKATLDTPVGKSAGSKDLDELVSAIRKNIHGVTEINVAIKTNVNATAKQLISRSKIIRDHVKSGAVKIIPAVYHLGTGIVEFLN